MAELKFTNSLNQDQSAYAIEIVKKAEELGVSPVLALGIAMKESSLNPGVQDSSAGAIGGMQVMPFNAKPFGYTSEQLRDPKINIEVGLKLLKENLERTNNNWPLAAALYNAGDKRLDNAAVAKSGLPDETKAYLKQLKQWGVFNTEPSNDAEPAAAETADEAAPDAAPADDAGEPLAPSPDYSAMEAKLAQRKEETADDAKIVKDATERFGAQAVGAGTGAVVSAKRMAPAAVRASARMLEEGRIAAQEAAAARAAQAAAQAGQAGQAAAQAGQAAGSAGRGPLSAIPSGGADGGRLAPGSTGNMPYNYAKSAGLTDIEAGKALDMTKNAGGVHDLASQRRAALGLINEIAPNQFQENPRFGGLMTPTGGGGGGPRESFKMAPEVAPSPEVPAGKPAGLQRIPVAAPVSTTPPKPGGLDYVTNLFKDMMDSKMARGAGTFMRYAAPPLALAGAAGEGMNIAQEMEKPSDQRNYGDMALSGLGAAAGLAALAPAATVAIPAGLAAMGIGGYRYLRDRAAAEAANRRMSGKPAKPVNAVGFRAP